MRTPEQIAAECQAAYERLKGQAESMRNKHPCAKCEWGDDWKGAWCHHPLIKGFGRKVFVGEEEQYQNTKAALCGPEKALWEPPRNCIQRLFDWFLKLAVGKTGDVM